MPCTEAYKEHIEYTFNAFCRVVIHYAAINAWRDRDKRRQREISFEYLTEEKFYPFCTSDTYFIQHQFRTSLFLRWEKLRCTQQAKAHNKKTQEQSVPEFLAVDRGIEPLFPP